MRFPVSDQ